MEQEEESSECKYKRLRVSEPDLKVIINYKDDEGKPAKKIFYLYSQVMARISNFFDTSLSVDMKERATGEIIFEDVSPELFETALNFQLDAQAIRSMTSQDAADLVEFYDKYEFVGGLELCDDILSEYIQQHKTEDGPQRLCSRDDLVFFVRVISLAKHHNMSKTLLHGINFLKADLEVGATYPYGSLLFDASQLNMLQPLFKEGILSLPRDVPREVLDNPMFGEFYVKCRSNHFLSRSLSGIELLHGNDQSGWKIHFHGLEAKNVQHFWCENFNLYDEDTHYNGGTTSLRLSQDIDHHGNWAVFLDWFHHDGEEGLGLALWRCPGSSQVDYPPRGPWLPVHQSTEGTFPVIYHGYIDDPYL